MLHRIKDALYFPVAHYFAFFAAIRLRRWKPRIVVITGSNGKTTTLHMLEARLGAAARYSHHRNSSFGIPFDLLELGDASGARWKWLLLALQAPFKAWRRPPAENIYVVEADCDRPGEGKFLSALLRPEVVVWLNCARTHSMRFEGSVQDGAFTNVDDAIAYEYGFFLERAGALCVVNADDARIMQQAARGRAKVSAVGEHDLSDYQVSTSGTVFNARGKAYSFPQLLPRDAFRAIVAAQEVARHFNAGGDDSLSSFTMPPGRSSLFRGIKGTTIMDSSYNANTGSMAAILAMTRELPGQKWLIFGDMTEQGAYENEEHEKVARLIAQSGFARVMLVGPRTRRLVLPILEKAGVPTTTFEGPRDALDYLLETVKGGEVLVFKGARFLEGIIEHVLADKSDAEKLCRREPIWRAWRTLWGL